VVTICQRSCHQSNFISIIFEHKKKKQKAEIWKAETDGAGTVSTRCFTASCAIFLAVPHSAFRAPQSFFFAGLPAFCRKYFGILCPLPPDFFAKRAARGRAKSNQVFYPLTKKAEKLKR